MATILNQGLSTSKNDLEEVYGLVQDERVALLGTVRDIQLAVQLLSAVEAKRLALKAGAADPRVASLASRDATIVSRVAALEVEKEVATIRVAPVAKTATLLHGRVTDDQLVAAGRMTVSLVDSQGQVLPNVPAVETDDAGYYAFVLTPEQVRVIGADKTVSVQLQRGDAKVIPAAGAVVGLAPGTVAIKEVQLTPSQLDQLQLKPIVVPTKVTESPASSTTRASTTEKSNPPPKASHVTKDTKLPHKRK